MDPRLPLRWLFELPKLFSKLVDAGAHRCTLGIKSDLTLLKSLQFADENVVGDRRFQDHSHFSGSHGP